MYSKILNFSYVIQFLIKNKNQLVMKSGNYLRSEVNGWWLWLGLSLYFIRENLCYTLEVWVEELNFSVVNPNYNNQLYPIRKKRLICQ